MPKALTGYPDGYLIYLVKQVEMGFRRPFEELVAGHGCVNVTVPNSTGGAVLHYCGSQAQSFCQASFRSGDQVSLRARPQCALAGLSPSADPSTAAS